MEWMGFLLLASGRSSLHNMFRRMALYQIFFPGVWYNNIVMEEDVDGKRGRVYDEHKFKRSNL